MPRNKNLLSLGIIVLIILLNLFWLPSTGWWGQLTVSADGKKQAALDILNFQHPLYASVTAKSLPDVQAQAYILVDNLTNQILVSKNPHSRIYPASTTKLATVLTALNLYPLDEVITADQYTEGQNMKLVQGEKMTVRNLVTALLVYSANDAAYNLANHYTGGVSGFVSQMNSLAQKYNLQDTHFVTFDGLHDPNHFSSAYDLSQFGRLAIKNPVVKETVKTRSISVTDIDGKISHPLVTTNELLGVVPEIEGLKTGWTPEAGGCFVGLINIGGHELISVVADSPDRFADTKNIVDWAKTNINWDKYKP
ncbi:MAG TPA: serine hydrolase [Patescibacteria group bacterium]